MNARDVMLSRLRRRKHETALEREFYCSAEEYQVDLDMIWYRDWLFVGHDCEVLNPGNYLTVQIGEYPVVVVRDRNGGLNAFHNSCRHRGSRICSAERGSVTRLVCPYHQWTYHLDGRLFAARDMGTGFDKVAVRPAPRALRERGRLHLGVPGRGGAGFRAHPPSTSSRTFCRTNCIRPRSPSRSTIVERANWKLVWENNRECYHCSANHPELIRTFPETPTVTGVEGAESNPLITAKWAHWESIGLPSRFHLVRQRPIPHLAHAAGRGRGELHHGRQGRRAPAAHRLHRGAGSRHAAAVSLSDAPGTTCSPITRFRFVLLPVSPTETQLTTKWLVHKDAVEGVDYDLKRMTEVWLATNEADRRVCQENQIGVNSPAYDPAPYSPVHEGGVIQFVDWYCTELEGRLTQDATIGALAADASSGIALPNLQELFGLGRCCAARFRGTAYWSPAWRDAAPKPRYDVLIIGGGGHGLATAYYLAKNHGVTNVAVRGARLDRRRQYRAQYHHRALQLFVSGKRAALRFLAPALRGTVPRAEFQHHAESARADSARAQPS